MQILDATENLRASLKRLYKPELAAQSGVPDDNLKRFLDGGFLSDDDKIALTNMLFPHLIYDPIHDRFASKTVTYAILQATAYLCRLVQDCRDKTELTRKTKINPVRLDAFASGQKDLSVDEKTQLAACFGINRKYDARADTLVNLPATSPPLINPPDTVARPWREQRVPTMRTVT